jgi:hypothetical protein
LLKFGYNPKDAIAICRAARKNTLNNSCQVAFVSEFEEYIKSKK